MFLKLVIFALVVLFVNAAPQNFVINGIIAQTRVPSYAVIIHSAILSGGHIITNRHILTAGHVVYDSANWFVGVGSNEITQLNLFLTSGGITHPDYNKDSRDNDIGIITLSQSVVYSENIQPIALPEPGLSLPHINEQGRIFGFGWTSDSSDFNNVLKIIFQRVIEPSLCSQYYTLDAEAQFCAADGIDSSNICLGDLGGGFITLKRDIPVLVGIASNTVDLCSASYPTIYTRVSQFRTWIKDVANI